MGHLVSTDRLRNGVARLCFVVLDLSSMTQRRINAEQREAWELDLAKDAFRTFSKHALGLPKWELLPASHQAGWRAVAASFMAGGDQFLEWLRTK